VYNFLKWQEELRCCYIRSINQERAFANNNPGCVERFFSNYHNVITIYNINEFDIWNMDKTGFAIGLAFSAKVVILRGRIINFKTVNGNRE